MRKEGGGVLPFPPGEGNLRAKSLTEAGILDPCRNAASTLCTFQMEVCVTPRSVVDTNTWFRRRGYMCEKLFMSERGDEGDSGRAPSKNKQTQGESPPLRVGGGKGGTLRDNKNKTRIKTFLPLV